MQIIQTIAGVRADHGGTSRSVPALCESLAMIGHEVHLVTGRPADQSVSLSPPDLSVQTHWIDESPTMGRLSTGKRFCRSLREIADGGTRSSIIHDHGLWLPSNHAVRQFATKRSLTRIVSPRGMLSTWSMSHNRIKKQLIWRLFQRSDLQSVKAFHATSEREASEIRSIGFSQPIAIIPNGTMFPKIESDHKPTKPRRCLFLSRIHPVKGLIMLLQAWKHAGPPQGWQLTIAGPAERNHLDELRQETSRLELDHDVQFLESVSDLEKWELYQSAELFVLPSYSENFGIVVAESLAAGVPVITTTGTPWREVPERGAGWWVDPTAEGLSLAITEAVAHSTDQLRSMGAVGRRWVRSEYQWPSIATRMSQFYEWLSDAGPRPSFVV